MFIVFLPFLVFSASAIPVIPDEISVPPQLKSRSAKQIEAVFSSLEKQHSHKTANIWRLKYHKAKLLKKKKTDSFCAIMKELSQSPAFPLKDLALIQSYELCPYPKRPEFRPKRFPEWLRLRLAQAFYQRRKVFEDPESALKAAAYLAKNSRDKELRISYLKHALSMANQQKKDQKEAELRELLYKEAPRLRPNPGVEDYLPLAEDFRQNRNFKKAALFYAKALKTPQTGFNEKNQSFKGLDRIYKIQRDNRKKMANYRRWSDWLSKEGTEQSLVRLYKLKLDLARERWNLNENEKAIQLVSDILNQPHADLIQADALYLRGLIYNQENKAHLSLKDWSEAIKKLRKKKSRSALLEKILWKRAWLLKKREKSRQAFYDLKKLEKISQSLYTQHKALFWQAKILQNTGQSALAKRSFKRVIKKDPFGYYGLLAHKILGQEPEFQKEKEPSGAAVFSKDRTLENLAHWLILAKESELLSRFLSAQKAHFLNQKNQTERDWANMISLWIKAKRHLEAFQSLDKMDSGIKASFLKKYSHLLFPLDFSQTVKRASRKWNVPEAFIFAIIRQESAFNVRARSLADAFGLMQLIPSTARQTARKLKIPYRGFRDLYNPSKNIFLGTGYFKSLLKRYNNSFALSVSAYNAGGTPVSRWRERMKDMGTLEFIENIPYRETRSYLRLIIRNYIFYHNALKEEGPWFPEWILQNPGPRDKASAPR